MCQGRVNGRNQWVKKWSNMQFFSRTTWELQPVVLAHFEPVVTYWPPKNIYLKNLENGSFQDQHRV